MKKERQSNYELMRIVSMLFIIIYHIIFHGRLLEHTTGTIHILLTLLLCLTLVHVNSFVLISGYFQYNKKFSVKSFFHILNSAWFYKVAFATIFIVTGLCSLSKVEYLKALNPFGLAGYWFIACYLIMYIISPFLNVLIKNLTQKQHRNLIIVSILCFSIFPFLSANVFGSNNGFTVIQFILLYFIGAYLAKYPIQKNLHFKNYSKNKLQLLLFVGFFLFTFINYIFYNFGITLENGNTSIGTYFGNQITNYTMHYNCILVLLQTICYFLWFGTLNLKNKTINFISPLVFGVYLIHDNPYVQVMIYKWLGFDTGLPITNPLIIAKVIIYAFGIFTVCALVEYIRKKIFKFIQNRKISKKLSNKFYSFIEQY